MQVMNPSATVPLETWALSKPPCSSARGVVATQEAEAAEVGAAMLRDGGNAIDAAIATALALTVTEPWMSGLGGGGFLVAWIAREQAVRVVDFGMRRPPTSIPAPTR